jgi:hypothetical protein
LGFVVSLKRWMLLAALATVASLGCASAVAAKTAHRVKPLTGTFVGTTSQKFSFRFKLEKHTATNHCGVSASTYCFIVLKYPDLNEPCAGGAPITGIYAMGDALLPASGIYHYHQPLQGPQDPLEDEWVNARATGITGHFREMSETDPGTGTLVKCDTGVVKWTSHRVSKHF